MGKGEAGRGRTLRGAAEPSPCPARVGSPAETTPSVRPTRLAQVMVERAKWRDCWEAVRFCSDRCRAEAKRAQRVAGGGGGGSGGGGEQQQQQQQQPQRPV